MTAWLALAVAAAFALTTLTAYYPRSRRSNYIGALAVGLPFATGLTPGLAQFVQIASVPIAMLVLLTRTKWAHRMSGATIALMSYGIWAIATAAWSPDRTLSIAKGVSFLGLLSISF